MFKLLESLLRTFDKKVYDFCDLETVEQETLVANDGSLATIIRLEGIQTLLPYQDFVTICKTLETDLAVFMQKIGYQIQVLYNKDFEGHDMLESIRRSKHHTAKNLQADLHSIIDEQINKYLEYVYNEQCYWVFWSRPTLLNQAENQQKQQTEQTYRKENVDILRQFDKHEHQYSFQDSSLLMQQHQAFVQTIAAKLQSLGFVIEILSAKEMLYSIRKHILPHRTDLNWQASYPGQPLPIRIKESDSLLEGTENQEKQVDILYTQLAKQLINAPAYEGAHGQVTDETAVKLGERIYLPVVFEVPPLKLQNFNELFSGLNRATIRLENGQLKSMPYSISFMIEGCMMGGFSLNQLLASFLGFLANKNQQINQAHSKLKQYGDQDGILAKLSISAMTWISDTPYSISQMAMQKASFIKTLQSWGNPVVIDKIGSPMQGLQSNGLALTYKPIAQQGLATLKDILAILPITRPASLFKQGNIVFRSRDGKAFRYQRFSSEQTTWITLITGRPGFGKSVLMNDNNIELCLSEGLQELPYICNIDIGVSSRGMIDLIRQSLPEDKQYLAMYARLQNTREFSVNPFDTPLGCRMPLAKDKTYLVNFLTILATPPERKGKAYQGMSDFISRLIDAVYRYKSGLNDRSYPNRYTYGHHQSLDTLVQTLELNQQNISYWNLVDTLFTNGHLFEAEVAQRYAVPLLDDFIAMASDHDISNEFKHAKTEQDIPINEAFQTGLRGAISQFPILANVTQFDVGSSRIMSLDLNDITTSGKTANDYKQNALMYMMARQCFAKKVAFSKEDLLQIPDLYKIYYENKINSLMDAFKTLCYDEYHRTGNIDAIENQTMVDARESRKWQMELVIASQFLEDMGHIASIATNIFICDAGTHASREYLKKTIGLQAHHEKALVDCVNGPDASGMSFLAIQDTKKNAKVYQIYTLSIGARRLWALSSTAEDRRLRQYLIEKGLTQSEALTLLAKNYPQGSCKKALEYYKQQHQLDEVGSVIELIAHKLLEEYFAS